jgi:hypothetical protein
MSISNIIDPTTRKIYPELIPPVPPLAIPNLNQVLTAGNSASIIGNPQTIENLDDLETGKVYQGNYLQLELGESGDTVLLKGTTALGTIHVGNGVSIEKLPVGANGLVLKANSGSITGLGVEWAVDAGSGLTGVGAGTNISVDNTVPLVPVVSLTNPLTSNVSLGTTSVDGTTGSLAFTNINVPIQSITSIQAGGISSYDSTSANQIAIMNKSGFTTQDTSANLMTIAPTSITKTGATAMSISSASSAITITPSATTDLNQVISGAGKVHTIQSSTGGATQPAYQIENTNAGANAVHIDLYKNSASPAVNDGIAGLSYHANNASATKIEYARIQADQRDTTAGSENGSVSVLACCSSATPVEVFRFNGSGESGAGSNDLYKALDLRNNRITTSTGNILIQNNLVNNGLVSLTNDGAQGTLTVSKNGTSSGSLNIYSGTTTSMSSLGATTLSGNGGIGSGIIINQSTGQNTTLTTNLSNVKYYPDFVLTNQNLNTVSVPTPEVVYERLTLINEGITNNNLWSPLGTAVASGYSAFFRDTNDVIWLATQGSGIIDCYDATIGTYYQQFYVENSGNPKAINCFFQNGSYIYIGGRFNQIQGNPTNQNSIARIYIGGGAGTYVEDPVWDSSFFIYGVENDREVYTLELENLTGNLLFGGNFQTLSNGATQCSFIGSMTNIGGSSGIQVFSEYQGGANASVYAIFDGGSGQTYVGGEFTIIGVNSIPQSWNYISYWDGANWQQVASNGFNGPVYVLETTSYGHLYVAGSFTALFGSFQNYNTYIEFSNPANYTDTTLSASNPITYKQAKYPPTAGILGVCVDGTIYTSTTYQAWVSLGTPALASGSLTGIYFWNGEWKVIYDSVSTVQSHTTLPDSCVFTGGFQNSGVIYGNYTISLTDVAQQFIGYGGYWKIIGQGVGIFS